MTLPAARRPSLDPQRRQLLCALAIAAIPAWAAPAAETPSADRWFSSSDGVRLHYLETGSSPPGQPTIVFVPGWTMPAWIWSAQLAHFGRRFRTLAFDPRGQGRSAVPPGGYEHRRRAQDIAELLAAAGADDIVLVGWSLGVLECLQYLHDSHAAGLRSPLRGLVLVDNSVGEGEPPPGNPDFMKRLRTKREPTVAGFVRGMFKRPQPQPWLDDLTQAALRMPLRPSIALLSQPTPREFWRETLYSLDRPVLYATTPRLAEQGRLAATRKPSIEAHLFEDAGHALFVDDAGSFNALLDDFVARLPQGAPR